MVAASPTLRVEFAFTSGLTDLASRMRADVGWKINRGSQSYQSNGFVADAGTFQCTFNNRDRALDMNNLSGPYVTTGVTNLHPGNYFNVIANWNAADYALFAGQADDWPNTSPNKGKDNLVPFKGTDAVGQLAKSNFPTLRAAEYSGARIAAVVASSAWPGLTSISHGRSRIGKLAYSLLSAWNHCQMCCQAEFGDLYVETDGTLIFRDRNLIVTEVRSNTPQAVYTDETNAYSLGRFKYGDAKKLTLPIINDLTNTYDDKGNQTNAQDAASIAADWGLSHKDLSLSFDTAAQSNDYCHWLVHLYKQPIQTFFSVTFDPNDNPAVLFPELMARKLGDMVTIRRSYVDLAPVAGGVGSVESRNCWVRGIEHVGRNNVWQSTTMWLQDASWISGLAKFDVSHFNGADVLAF